jgi:methylamine---glutamate N-methyltransferase subunit A
MCGIAGLIYRNGGADGEHEIGRDMTRMLQSMKHRGPDSTGYALYRPRADSLLMRVKLGEGDEPRDAELQNRLRRRRHELEARMRSLGARIANVEQNTDYVVTVTFDYDGDLREITDRVEAVKGAEVLSLGHALEIVKDLGDAESVAAQYGLDKFHGTHAIGHVRMATESDVDIASAHPYWAYPFPDVAVVHNGQLTNYHQWRRRLERSGHRFQSDCDSEVIAVYLAQKLAEGVELEDAIRQSLHDFDGVFTYICVTEDALGAAKDELAAKPLVLYESEDLVALASEEIAIREVLEEEIETHDPYEGEVMVWKR